MSEAYAARRVEAPPSDTLRRKAFLMALEMLCVGPGRMLPDADDADAAPFLADGRRLLGARADAAVDAFFQEGYVVLDVDFDDLAALRGDLDALYDRGALAAQAANVQVAAGTRGDATGYYSVSSALDLGAPTLARALRALSGVAAVLDAHPRAARGYRVPAKLMASRYPGPDETGAAAPPYRGYKRHQDNERLPDGGCANQRAATAILYANDADWPDDRGGHLVLYPAGKDDDDAAVAVAPKGGRLVLFDSFLWHEVRPAGARRYALTNWITRADLQ